MREGERMCWRLWPPARDSEGQCVRVHLSTFVLGNGAHSGEGVVLADVGADGTAVTSLFTVNKADGNAGLMLKKEARDWGWKVDGYHHGNVFEAPRIRPSRMRA